MLRPEEVTVKVYELADSLLAELGLLHGRLEIVVADGKATEIRSTRRVIRGKSRTVSGPDSNMD
jgi:hypothetical protein